MVLDAVSNFVRGRADAQLTAEATTLSVEDASIFPDPEDDGEYNVVIWDANNFPRPDQDSDVEIVRVTGRDTDADELTVVRGQETTSDVAHPEGSAVHLSPTAKMFSDIEAEYTAQGENFDGQGTSVFSNLQSVSTEDLSNNDYSLERGVSPRFTFDDERVDLDIDLSDLNVQGNDKDGDVLVLEVRGRQDQGDTTDSPLKVQVAENTDENYQNIWRDGTGLTKSTETEWILVDQNASGSTFGEWFIGSARSRPGLFGNGTIGITDAPVLQEGTYDDTQDIDSIQIFQEQGEAFRGWIQLAVRERS